MNVHLLIPGHGHEQRVLNLKMIVNRVLPTRCTVFMYKNTSFRDLQCDLVYTRGLWTNFMKAFKRVEQNLDILLIMDDVVVPKNIKLLHRSPEKDVVSASILKWHHRVMRPLKRFEHTWRRTTYVDMLAVRFSPLIWDCWVNQIDLQMNPSGWGYDVSFYKVCKANMNIQDNCTVLHPLHSNGPTYSHRQAKQEQAVWLKHMNISRRDTIRMQSGWDNIQ